MTTLLDAFAEAWNRHDVDALMSMMTADCIFDASAGNAVEGERYEGPHAVRAAFAAVFEQYPDAHWGNARHFVAGDRGVSEWIFTGTRKDGARVEVNGCDLFTFREGKIAIKNSYRKNRPPKPRDKRGERDGGRDDAFGGAASADARGGGVARPFRAPDP